MKSEIDAWKELQDMKRQRVEKIEGEINEIREILQSNYSNSNEQSKSMEIAIELVKQRLDSLEVEVKSVKETVKRNQATLIKYSAWGGAGIFILGILIKTGIISL